MDFNDYPACRTGRHYGKGIPATHKVKYSNGEIDYFCWECVCRYKSLLRHHTITILFPNTLTQEHQDND